MYYETDTQNKQIFNFKLAPIHRDIKTNYEYYQRCIKRLKDLFESDIKKFYIYIHPIQGINDFNKKNDIILKDFNNFDQFISKKTNNTFGIYFIIVKHDEIVKSIKLIETSTFVVFVIYCNKNFHDNGITFYGDIEEENKEILSILKIYLQ